MPQRTEKGRSEYCTSKTTRMAITPKRERTVVSQTAGLSP